MKLDKFSIIALVKSDRSLLDKLVSQLSVLSGKPSLTVDQQEDLEGMIKNAISTLSLSTALCFLVRESKSLVTDDLLIEYKNLTDVMKKLSTEIYEAQTLLITSLCLP